MATLFRLLGELEVRVDDRVVEVGHSRQRCVLVALLVDANRPVPVDHLIDRVWADHPPLRARGVLYNYLSRLRHVLVAADDVRIAHRPGGYVLAVDPLAVDVHRFQHLTDQARAADNDVDALALFEQALGLWRGEVLATLDMPWLNAVRTNLDGKRLAAELDRNDIALRHGHHARLLADLFAAATTRPLDERLAGQLMLALYRSGRQADALIHYEQIRHRLADELGTDPSPPLRDLHQRILTADSTLAAPTTHRAAKPVVPRQLPAPLHSFTGRAHELAHLDSLLAAAGDGPTAVIISAMSGTAGIGKTALAVYWAHRVAAQFPDGQLYVNLRGFDPTGSIMSPTEAVRRFLDALDVPPQRIPADLDTQAALYRSLLADKRMLIVLDNARDMTQVRPLLPGNPTCLVLVTSRNQLSGLIAAESAHPMPLDLLSLPEARELLARRLGHDRLVAEPDAVEQIITRCARLPLALAIVAARAATHPHFPLTTLANELRDAGDRLDALAGDDPHADIRAVFSWSCHTLTPDAARLFRLLGLHPGPDLTAAAAASLAALPMHRVAPLLTELAWANLIVEHVPGRYVLHDLLRAYANEQARTAEPVDERHAATRRMLDHYLHTAHASARLLASHRDQPTLGPPQRGVSPEHPGDHQQALTWFIAEHPVLLSAMEHAAGAGLDTHICQLAWTLVAFLDQRGHWQDLALTGQAALDAARRLADPTAQARAHRSLALAYMRLDRHDDAHTHAMHALDLHRESGCQVGQADSYYDLAILLGQQGRIAEASDDARRALDLYRAAGHRQGQANTLNAIGWHLAQLGDHQQALVECQQALALFQALGNRVGQAAALDSIGYAHHHLDHREQATASYEHALDLRRTLGDRYNEAQTLVHLGDAHNATGDSQAARRAWQAALTILDDLDHGNAEQVREKLRHHDKADIDPTASRSS